MKKILILLLLTLAACDEGQDESPDFVTVAAHGNSESDATALADSCQVPERPPVDFSCWINPEEISCDGQASLLNVECNLLYEGDHPRSFEHLLVSFADERDREACLFTEIYWQEGIGDILQPGDELPAVNFKIRCSKSTWDNSLDLIFGLYDEIWFEDLDTASIKLRSYHFDQCLEDSTIEGWPCQAHAGYPLWVKASGADFEILKSGPAPYGSGDIPDNGFTFSFSCDELPAVIKIRTEDSIEALAYGHDLTDFSVWLNYDQELQITPAEGQNFNAEQLEMSDVHQNILIRIPALPAEI